MRIRQRRQRSLRDEISPSELWRLCLGQLIRGDDDLYRRNRDEVLDTVPPGQWGPVAFWEYEGPDLDTEAFALAADCGIGAMVMQRAARMVWLVAHDLADPAEIDRAIERVATIEAAGEDWSRSSDDYLLGTALQRVLATPGPWNAR